MPAVYDDGNIMNNYLKFLKVLRTGSGRFVLFEFGYSSGTSTWLSNFVLRKSWVLQIRVLNFSLQNEKY